MLELGNVLVAVQPSRGFGDNPVAVYHSPDLPPVDSYVEFYRWLDEGWEGASISVNLSARQFEHPKMLEMIDG